MEDRGTGFTGEALLGYCVVFCCARSLIKLFVARTESMDSVSIPSSLNSGLSAKNANMRRVVVWLSLNVLILYFDYRRYLCSLIPKARDAIYCSSVASA